jgi:tetratricopeptide (TPR) repeat protein
MTLLKASLPLVLAGALLAQSGFDYNSVQRDMLTGISGNPEAFKRAMAACEKTLAENPNHPEALIYHGIGLLFQSQGDAQVFPKALAEMDRAVELDPNSLSVRIPRGSAVMAVVRQMPDSPMTRALLEKAQTDFEYAYGTQKAQLAEIGTHPLGELLQNLGDIKSRLNQPDDAQKYYELIQRMLPKTEYARRANQWMESKQPLPAAQTSCIGCHTGEAR